MSTMRYVGARYVPKWYVNSVDQTADWEVNVEYEPLTWVTTPNNHLYLSKKTVPDNIGTPAQNTSYWLDMGQMTGDLQNIQDEIDAIVANMGDLNDLDTTDKSSLVAAINEVVNGGGGGTSGGAIKDKHIVIMGDSYADDNPTDYAYIIQSKNIFKQVDVVAGGGWGFTGKDGAGSGTTGPTLEWLTHFTDFVDALTDEEKADIDDVYIVGGFNDHYSSTATIKSHIADFFTYAKTALPKAKYHVGMAGWCKDGTITTPQGSFNGYAIRADIVNKVLPAYMTVVEYGAEFMGHFIYEMHNYTSDYDSTDYHPSAAASAKIADALLAKILGQEYSTDVVQSQYVKRIGTETQAFAMRRDGNNLHLLPTLPGISYSFQNTTGNAIAVGNNFPIDTTYVATSETYNWIGTRGGSFRSGLNAMIRKAVSGQLFVPCQIGIKQDGTGFTILTLPIEIDTSSTYQFYFLESVISMLDC